MPPNDMDYLEELGLQPRPAAGETALPTPAPADASASASARPIPLSEYANPAARPRVLIADDDAAVVASLAISAEQYRQALDTRFWRADQDEDLLVCLERLNREGWRPQLLVLDINLAHGGQSGLDYLARLREANGWASLAVVLATAQHKRDLDADRIISGKNVTQVQPHLWLEQAKSFAPEAILYGKSGSAEFLGRVGESLPTWGQIARRRAWQGLLDRVAEQLDGTPAIAVVGNTIVDYAKSELAIDHIFVRWRAAGSDQFKLVAWQAPAGHVASDDHVRIEDVHLLGWLKDRKPVAKENLEADDLGRFQAMAGRRFLGAAAVLDDRIVGFVTLFREPGQPSFDLDVDGKPLGILARLLASALGREDAIERLRERQQALLAFAGDLTKKEDRESVCACLATFLHRELHGKNDSNGKVTVRLLNYGSGDLERKAHLGIPCDAPEISYLTLNSVYAATVRDNAVKHYDDVTRPEYQTIYLPAAPGIHAELCVPLAIGDQAIGAVNLEHKTEAKYKPHDLAFVRSAVALAANALENLHGSSFADSLLAFVESYAGYHADQAERDLRAKLHEFCGYSVLLTLEPSVAADLTQAWKQVGEPDIRLAYADKEKIEKEIADIAADPALWNNTWIAKLVKAADWNRAAASFTKDPADFSKVNIVCQGEVCYTQTADAVLWIRQPDRPPHRLILLLWGLPPFVGAADRLALERFARLFSALQARESRIRSLLAERVLGEQAAAIGHVMQHFRHRLVNNTGAINGYLLALAAAAERGDLEAIRTILPPLQQASKGMANSFSKAQGYVKKAEPRACPLAGCVAPARTDLRERLAPFAWKEDLPADRVAWTDPAIASLIVYSLLENAADALAGRTDGRIDVTAARLADGRVSLRVADNGPGIPRDKVTKLFRFGETTKSGGLGSALAFARIRAKALGAELRYAPEQPSPGAAFELLLPGERASFERAAEHALEEQ